MTTGRIKQVENTEIVGGMADTKAKPEKKRNCWLFNKDHSDERKALD